MKMARITPILVFAVSLVGAINIIAGGINGLNFIISHSSFPLLLAYSTIIAGTLAICVRALQSDTEMVWAWRLFAWTALFAVTSYLLVGRGIGLNAIYTVLLASATIVVLDAARKEKRRARERQEKAVEQERRRQEYLQTQHCPNCSRSGYNATKYCAYCGFGKESYNQRVAAAKGWKICPQCGEPYAPAHYCQHCNFGKDDFLRCMAAVDHAYRHGRLG